MIAWIKRHLHTWDEICYEEGARQRTNLLLFTFVVLCLYVVMVAVDLAQGLWQLLPGSLLLLVVEAVLFTVQFRSREYRPWVARVFALMALCMSVYFLYSGGLGGYSFLWILLVPHIASLVQHLKECVIYNSILVLVVAAMLLTPLYELLQYEYSMAFRAMFPLALFVVSLCAYLAEYVRYRIQTKLQATTRELESFAFTDPLTRAYNRRALASHFGDLQGDAYGLAFAVLDLDFFKEVNDQYGHIAGDEVLKHVVQCVRGNIPPGALLYRWGGEEFLLVLKTADRAAAAAVLEQVRKQVEQTPLQLEMECIPVTISIGAVCPQQSGSIQSCIAAADGQLYLAKQAGRNRVAMAE